MQPFYYFSFFTYEYTSPVLQGQNPNFDIRKGFECEVNSQFMEYMRTQVLKIDLIDESVDLAQAGAKDYIGSVRIPLREVMLNEEVADNFPVRDENGVEVGRMEVKLACKDYSPYPYGTADDKDLSVFRISKYAEREIVAQIAEKFA